MFGILFTNQIQVMYPEIFLGLVAFGMLLLGRSVKNPRVYTAITMASLFIALFLLLTFDSGNETLFGGSYLINNFGLYFAVIMIISSLYVTFSAGATLKSNPESFFSIFLLVNVSMMVAAFSNNLIYIFIAFEGVSIGTYIMSAYGKTRRNLEASAKYFFTGIIATGFILFGSSFYYLSTGTFNLLSVNVSRGPMLVALIMLFVGFGFKLALVPLQQWAVDAYDGTANPVSAFLSTGTKVLAFLIVLRVFIEGFRNFSTDVFYLFVIVSIITMTYGNMAALSENNVKRMLAYSSIAQAGYLILVVAATSASTTSAFVFTVAMFTAMYYSLVYIFMKGGAFLSVSAVRKNNVEIDDMAGIGTISPAFAISFSILMLSLAGIPPTAGFFAKYYLFLALIGSNLWWLAVIGILNSAISVFYYLKIIVVMFRKDVDGKDFNTSRAVIAPLVLAAALSLILSLFIFAYPQISAMATGLGVSI